MCANNCTWLVFRFHSFVSTPPSSLALRACSSHDSGYKERGALRDSLADSLSKVEGLEQEVTKWKVKSHKVSALGEKVEKLQKLKAESDKFKLKADQLRKERAASEAELGKWKVQRPLHHYTTAPLHHCTTAPRHHASQR